MLTKSFSRYCFKFDKYGKKNPSIVPDKQEQNNGKEKNNIPDISNADIYGDPINIEQINDFLEALFENKNETPELDIFDISDFTDK